MSFYPAEDEEDEGEHEASVIAVVRANVTLVRPLAVGSKHNHGSLDRK